MSPSLWFLSGPPGSGKSTLAQALAEQHERSIHIDCDALYNMVQGGHKAPWEPGAEALFTLMYQTLIAQTHIYVRAGFTVIADYVWSPQEVLFLYRNLGSTYSFHPVFLLPERALNIERDRNRPYPVGSERVADYWNEFDAWRQLLPELFIDNSLLGAHALAQRLIQGRTHRATTWVQSVALGFEW